MRCEKLAGKGNLVEMIFVDDVEMILPPLEFGVLLAGDLDFNLGKDDLLDVIQFSDFENTRPFQDSNVIFAHFDGANIGGRVGYLYFFASFVDVEEDQLVLSEAEDFVSEDFEQNDVGAEFLKEGLAEDLHRYLAQLMFMKSGR